MLISVLPTEPDGLAESFVSFDRWRGQALAIR
jgi:hypothetical protein